MPIPAEKVPAWNSETLVRVVRRYGWTGGLGGALIAAAILATMGLGPSQ